MIEIQLYIDASNDESTGLFRPVGTIADYKPVTLKEHWNSPYMMDIRKKLMAGEEIPQCNVCNDSVLSQSTYRQWFTGYLFENKIDQCFEETDEDGRTNMDPISFDYRVSNLCNFKCRMCGEPLSSTWETEKRKHDLWTPESQPFMVPENKKIINLFKLDIKKALFVIRLFCTFFTNPFTSLHHRPTHLRHHQNLNTQPR